MTTPELRRLRSRIDDRQAKIVVIGQGYVGLPLAMRAAEMSFPVVGYDVTPARIDELRAGRSYVEDVPDTQLGEALHAGYLPSCEVDDLRAFDIAVITVQTPLNEGTPDLSFIESAGHDLARFLSPARSSCSSRPRTPERPRSCCGRFSKPAACGPRSTSSSVIRRSGSTPAIPFGRS
jgi:UDP-glucose/GDP-mannose dehydrogenase family, NAD binding domain